MKDSLHALTPEALTMMDVIARNGSFAAAARELGKVPSSLTYSVRLLEDALDVLLFDRRSRQARLTAAGEELLDEGRRLLSQMDAVANRVKRVATGWETQLSIAVDGVISQTTMFELCEAFYALERPGPAAGGDAGSGPGTRLRLRTEVMTGTWEALTSGQADLAIGVGTERGSSPGIQTKDLGAMPFVFVVAPHHPLARADAPLTDVELLRHRAVAVSDSAQRLSPQTINLLPGQDVLTVSDTPMKLEALLRGLGCGFLPQSLVAEHVEAGRLRVMPVQRPVVVPRLAYAWRTADGPGTRRSRDSGLALRWWLAQLDRPTTRAALLRPLGAAAAA